MTAYWVVLAAAALTTLVTAAAALAVDIADSVLNLADGTLAAPEITAAHV